MSRVIPSGFLSGVWLVFLASGCQRQPDLEWESDPAQQTPLDPSEPWQGFPTGERVWSAHGGFYRWVLCATSDEERVYAMDDDFYPTAFELASGELAWTSEHRGIDAMVAEGIPDLVVYNVEAFHRSSGESAWSLNGELPTNVIWLTVADDTLFSNAAIDVTTGNLAWLRADLEPRARAEVDDRAVYLHGYDFQFHALDRLTGETLWSVPWRDTARPARSDGERVYLQAADSNSQLTALDAATGDVVWQTDRPEVDAPFFSGWSRATVADGRVYAFRYDEQRMFALDAATGEVVWATLFYGARGVPPLEPTVHEGEVYVFGLNEFLRVVDAETGEPRWWSGDIGAVGESGCAPRIHGDYVMLTDGDAVHVVRRP